MNTTSKFIRPCSECGGERVLAEMNDRVTVIKLERRSLFDYSYTYAQVCTNCGLISLYAKDPMKVVVKRPDKALEE